MKKRSIVCLSLELLWGLLSLLESYWKIHYWLKKVSPYLTVTDSLSSCSLLIVANRAVTVKNIVVSSCHKFTSFVLAGPKKSCGCPGLIQPS